MQNINIPLLLGGAAVLLAGIVHLVIVHGAWTAYTDYSGRFWWFKGAGKKSDWEIWQQTAQYRKLATRWFWYAAATLCVLLLVIGVVADSLGTPRLLAAGWPVLAFQYSRTVMSLTIIISLVVVFAASALECSSLRQRRRIIQAEAHVTGLNAEQAEARTQALSKTITSRVTLCGSVGLTAGVILTMLLSVYF